MALLRLLQGVFIVYLIILFYPLFGWFKKIYLGLMVLWLTTGSIADLFFAMIYNTEYNEFFIGVIAGTNPAEAQEFLKTYITWDILLLLTVTCVASIITFWLADKWRKAFTLKQTVSLSIICGVLAIIIIGWAAQPIKAEYSLPCEIKIIDDLFTVEFPDEACNRQPLLQIDEGGRPEYIVLIIGESLCRDKCSVYGYEKQTTPNFERMVADSTCIAFDNAIAPWLNTSTVFKTLMTTCSSLDEKTKWNEAVTLPVAAQTAGYKTYWCSNQKQAGIWENIQGLFARQCDIVVWTSNDLIHPMKYSYDEVLIPEIKRHIGNPNSLFIVNLIGNHEEFKLRYPETFDRFSPNEYSAFLSNQRAVRAEYDNSVFYNDSVVHEIYNLFKNKEAIIIYTSDHALDIFDSKPDYVGHGKPHDPMSDSIARRVPMLVMETPRMRERFPEVATELRAVAAEPYYTADIMFGILRLMNVRAIDGRPITRF